jgi:hypothetical protein
MIVIGFTRISHSKRGQTSRWRRISWRALVATECFDDEL